MHRFTLLATLLLIITNVAAAPVDINTARIAGTHFLQQKGLIEPNDTLTLYAPAMDGNTPECYYVFNYGEQGFVIVSADDRCIPVIGYSMNGRFNNELLPDNMRHWLQEQASDIRLGIEANAPENPEHLTMWKKLLSYKSDSQTHQPKADSYLLTSTWEQGSGYNNYCPVMNGQHVVVGCVATATTANPPAALVKNPTVIPPMVYWQWISTPLNTTSA